MTEAEKLILYYGDLRIWSCHGFTKLTYLEAQECTHDDEPIYLDIKLLKAINGDTIHRH